MQHAILVICFSWILQHPQMPSHSFIQISASVFSCWSTPTQYRFPCQHRSLLNSRCVVRPSSLNDLWSWWAGLVILVAVIGCWAVTAFVVAHMDDHAGSGWCCCVKLVLPPWPQFRDGTKQVIVDDRGGVLRLFPADWRGSRRRDQELLLWLGRLQPRTPYVHRLSEVKSHFFAVEVRLM